MAFSELVKSFENIRLIMRDFYVFGFKSRADFTDRSTRSYDNERRRIESWLGEYMYFRNDFGGKKCFISVDSKKIKHNPFYKAWKAKSFTSNDIMLHFFIFDILQKDVKLTLRQLMDILDKEYIADFSEPITLDISTVRKKLAEYVQLGLLIAEKHGKELVYERSSNEVKLADWKNPISFFSEAGELGVIGSFLEDKLPEHKSHFSYKHHYLLHALESDVLLDLFSAMEMKQTVRLESYTSKGNSVNIRVLPLKIYISTKTGRRYLLCWFFKASRIIFCRLDNLERVSDFKAFSDYDKIYALAEKMEANLWGVAINNKLKNNIESLEHVELILHIGLQEKYILQKLENEKRCGIVQKLDTEHYRFTANVQDSGEMLPWLRNFIGYIDSFTSSNKEVEATFWQDVQNIYVMYGLERSGEADEQCV